MPGWPLTFRRVRKRGLLAVVLIVLAVALVSYILLQVIANLPRSGAQIRFSIDGQSVKPAILGQGIDLPHMGSANYLRDGSFESPVRRRLLTILDGDAETLAISAEEAYSGSTGDDFFDAAAATVLTRRSEGLSTKKSASVRSFGMDRIGAFRKTLLPADLPAESRFLDFARDTDGLTIACGSQGLLVYGIGSAAPVTIDSHLSVDLIALDYGAGQWVVAAADGTLLLSPDGQTWRQIDPPGPVRLNDVRIDSRGVIVAVGSSVLVRSDEISQLIDSGADRDLLAVIDDNDQFFAFGRAGTVLRSSNGLIWQELDLGSDADWIAADSRDGRCFAVAADGRTIAFTTTAAPIVPVHARLPSQGRDVLALSARRAIVITDHGHVFSCKEGGTAWSESGIRTDPPLTKIALAGQDRIVAASEDGQLGLGQLTAEITLDSPLKEGTFQSGDLLMLSKTFQAEKPDGWTFSGSGEAVRLNGDAAPGGGEGSLRLIADDPVNPLIMTQTVRLDQTLTRRNERLEVSLWLRQTEELANQRLQIWLTGPFTPVGTTIRHISPTWKKHSFVLTLPEPSLGQQSPDIQIHLSIGLGSLQIDRVALTRAGQSPDAIIEDVLETMRSVRPQSIRFSYLGLGEATVPSDLWAEAGDNSVPVRMENGWMSRSGLSLSAGLKLADEVEADPWIVVDIFASEADLLNLIEYLAAPITEPYGQRRQEAGTFDRWTDRFRIIRIEAADLGGNLDNDRLRADFVNRVIAAVRSSPYFNRLKNLAFIDGMHYQDGVLLSDADYHATDLKAVLDEDRRSNLQTAFREYYEQIPRDLERPALSRSSLIRSLEIQNATPSVEVRLADVLNLALADLGRQSAMANIAWPDKAVNASHRQIVRTAASITSVAARGRPLNVQTIRVSGAEPIPPEGENIDLPLGTDRPVEAYAFQDQGQIRVVLVSSAADTRLVALLSDEPIWPGRLLHYDAAGNLVGEEALRRTPGNIALLPGGAAVLIQENSSER